MSDVVKFVRSQHERYLQELKEYLAIPSISSDPEKTQTMVETAVFTAELLRNAGCPEVKVNSTDGHPCVTGSWIFDESLPTIMIYGHYDVQPVDPLDLWNSDPFDAQIVGDTIVARGSADDKGQLFMHIKAVEAYTKTVGKPPINIKFLLEGEEEIASPSLAAFLEKNKDDLKADIIIISDTGMIGPGKPAITYGLKGLTYMELDVTGPDHDLHSGEFGGAVANPVEILARMVASVKDENGRIQIPGFYDKVAEVTAEERAELARVPFDETDYKKHIDVDALWGEEGFSTVERTWIRPTFEVNGMWGGFIEPGAKTVLPSKAGLKMSMRLVPDQDPNEIADLVEDYFNKIAPDTIKLKVIRHGGGYPVVVSLDNPFMDGATKALNDAFNQQPYMIRGGGSIPIVADFKKILGLDSLLVGFCSPSARVHSPNENMDLPSFFTGIESLVLMYENFADLKK
ncbi:MAG: dipeptidase [Calditrichaeota bacterium]|jgi:acetylornithine deacetylase/succinyl-diaminopimelate desuccinylase-like protein|nr:dipeptidase [Calditrichota bacterium]MBT7788830.1 dipeptidase [Calditrichota bacterium]